MSAAEEPRRALRKDAERNRQRVVDAARDLFAQRGLEATLNDVAHHANVGVGTVYRRFATKQELLDAIFRERHRARWWRSQNPLCNKRTHGTASSGSPSSSVS